MKDGSHNFHDNFKNTSKQRLNMISKILWPINFSSGTHINFRDPTIIIVPEFFPTYKSHFFLCSVYAISFYRGICRQSSA